MYLLLRNSTWLKRWPHSIYAHSMKLFSLQPNIWIGPLGSLHFQQRLAHFSSHIKWNASHDRHRSHRKPNVVLEQTFSCLPVYLRQRSFKNPISTAFIHTPFFFQIQCLEPSLWKQYKNDLNVTSEEVSTYCFKLFPASFNMLLCLSAIMEVLFRKRKEKKKKFWTTKEQTANYAQGVPEKKPRNYSDSCVLQHW